MVAGGDATTFASPGRCVKPCAAIALSVEDACSVSGAAEVEAGGSELPAERSFSGVDCSVPADGGDSELGAPGMAIGGLMGGAGVSDADGLFAV